MNVGYNAVNVGAFKDLATVKMEDTDAVESGDTIVVSNADGFFKYYTAEVSEALKVVGVDGKTVNAKYTAKNETDSVVGAYVIVCAYDENGKLLESTDKASKNANGLVTNMTATFDGDIATASVVKVFVFDKITNLKPVCKNTSYTIRK